MTHPAHHTHPTRPAPGRDTGEVGRLAGRIATAVADCPAVAALADGPVATYLPGSTVVGVAVRDTEVKVEVVAVFGRPVTEVAAQVRAAVHGLMPGTQVEVCIDDIELPDSAARETLR
ncbi:MULTISPECIES: hypothetical protein [Streptomyces]|uniref:Asp23/Gls24 family envelope stress response protein n=1 Tax=Streptomyces lonegramiae TaxID=3075524 RepID=A0ABU2XVB4_9ACTN|nr:hypothetical protein [Streptomyces sp. DSM 41529]MDT0548758.1 hypothetical protein [Streptomyces sp. DSM 41529]